MSLLSLQTGEMFDPPLLREKETKIIRVAWPDLPGVPTENAHWSLNFDVTKHILSLLDTNKVCILWNLQLSRERLFLLLCFALLPYDCTVEVLLACLQNPNLLLSDEQEKSDFRRAVISQMSLQTREKKPRWLHHQVSPLREALRPYGLDILLQRKDRKYILWRFKM